MIPILQKIIFFICWFWLMPSLAMVQYKPISSMERSGFYGGGIVDYKSLPDLKNIVSGYSLQYHFFIPEMNKLVAQSYRDFFKISLGLGAHWFKKAYDKNQFQCESSKSLQTLIYRGGLRGAFTYVEYFTPFVEFGLARSRCFSYKVSEKISFEKPSNKFKSYISFGLFLSFKLIDKIAIYSLDKDYGINDIGIIGQCSWFHREEKAGIKLDSKLAFCEAGLSFKL